MKYHPLTFALRLPVLFALLLVYSLQPTAYSLTPTVRINEVMASNGTTLADDDGDFEDWIELYNYGTEPVDLSGWGLSDSYNNPFKWTFPVGTTIGAGDYLLVWASGKDRDPSSFGSGRWLFNEGGGSVVTDYSPVNNDGVIVGDGQLQSDEFFDGAIDLGVEGRVDLELFVSLEEDFTVAYWFKTRRANDWRALNVRNGFGPGHQRSNRIVLMSPYLVINLSESFVVSQWEHITLRRADGVLTVFRNAAPVAEVSWNGTVVFDRIGGTSGSSAWPAFDGKLAEVFALSSALSNEEVGLLFDGNLGDRGQWHTNYSLSASGEEVILTMPDGTRVDELSPTALPRDVSIGRVNGEGDAWFFFDQPTPGGINDTTAYLGILDPPNFSHAGGFYEEGFDLVLSHPDPEVTIVYTLDGSVPDINNIGGTIYFYKNSYPRVLGDPFGEFIESSFVSEIYNDPIEISDRSLKPNTISMISSTAEKNPNYFPTNPVRKGTVIRAAVFREGFLQSQLLTNSYFVFEDSKMYSLPIISLAVSPVDLFDYDEGIYVAGIDYDQWWIDHPGTQPPHHFHLLESFNFWRSGRLSERNANIEFLDRNINALSLLNSEAGIRVHGNASRLHSKKNLRFYARDTMGGSLFQHRFFDSEIPFSYRSDFFPRRLLLRGRGNGGPFINDWFTSKILQPVYEGISRVKAVVHFINGEYWGISAIRDRFDQYHLANAFNLDPDEIIITWRNAIDVGDDLDLFIVNQSLTYLENLDMENPNAFSAIQDHLCVRSYIDHLVANIYFSNTHHEYGFWRTRNPSGVGFDDGRLRVYTQDFDQILRTEDRLSVRRRSALLGNLLENASFLRYFVNRFCDHINTTFAVARMELVAEEGYAELLPYIGEDFDRWNSVFMTRGQVDSYIQYAREQPERQREFLRQNLGVGEDAKISIVRTQEGQGDVRVNTVIINENTPGVSATPYPWTGTYFQGVPIELEALPEPGHRFVGWVVSPAGGMASLSEGEPDFYSTEPLISLDLSGDTTVEAVFEPIPLADLPVAIHVWDFEDAGAFQNDGTLIAPSVTIGDGALVITPGPNPQWEAIPNTGGDFLTQHLRVNFPLGTTLTFALPTTGFESITLDFLTRRSGQGAEEMFVEYTLDGETWTSALEDPDYLTIFNAAPQVQGFDFSDVAGVSDNPDFAVRFTFAQGENGGTAGNNRFDDVILSGVALPGVNLPPVVTAEAPAFLELAADRPLVVDLGDWFADPEGDALTFAALSANAGLLGIAVAGSELTLTGLAAGETTFAVSANDGSNPSVTHTVRVLIYGAPHELAAGDFSFTAWSPDEPAGSFPPNMLFVQSNVNDPGLAEPLLFAYSIAGDAHADDDAAFPYRATARTRLTGLGEDGISFINTGRGRDLGGAVVSLDTTGKANVRVSFTGGTVLANARVYGLRLQYRVGLESAWADVFDGESVVEYIRATDGDTETFEAIALPAEVSDAPLVQLRWKYFHISGTSGARAMLRLDDIVVTAGEPGAATALAFAPGLPQWVQSGVAPGLLEVRAVDEDGALDPDFAGAVTLSLLGDGVLSGTLTAAAVDGVATFGDWVVTGPDGVFELLATAPGLTPAVSDALLLSTFPVFLPGGDGDWTVGANWTSVLFPNGTGLGAFVPAPALGDRNVNLRAPVSIGSLIMDTGETAFRNRLRDRSTGNTLTFNGGGVPALLRITGTGEGFVELQNEAGAVLATDLRLAVENAVGDGGYGALRLREAWSGPGGLIKEGPGMASLTGGDKNFAGAVLIEQGVLALTEPSVPANASGVTVLDGGQLRLVSASSESNPVRIYTFGGTLSLSGFGRSGVEEGEGMGILGALRYEPGSFGNLAEVSSGVVLAADAGIHVAGENTLALTGWLSGNGALVKSGGGSLVLGNAPSTFTGVIEIERGELRFAGTNLSGNASTLSVVAEAALGGTGQWGGAVVLAGGSALRFDFATGLPASAPLVLGEWSAGGAIAVEVALPAGVTGPQRVALIEAGAFATAPGGEVSNWVLSGAEAFPLSRLERAGEGLVLLLAATPFDLWTLENFGGPDLADPAISGPLGEPLGDGVPNLLKYALGVGALERVDTEALSSGLDVGGHLFLRFRRDPAKADIVYVVEASADLLDWTETLYDSGIDLIPNNDGAHMVVSDSTAPSPGSPRFLRLRVKGTSNFE